RRSTASSCWWRCTGWAAARRSCSPGRARSGRARSGARCWRCWMQPTDGPTRGGKTSLTWQWHSFQPVVIQSFKSVAPSAVAAGPQDPLRASHFRVIWGSVSLPKHKRYWGTQRVARVCQVSPATVANWIDQGLLKGHKTPTGRRRGEAEALTAFLRVHEMGRRLDAEVMVVTGGMPPEAAVQLRQMGVKVILNKSEGMPAVVEAMREALRRRKAA